MPARPRLSGPLRLRAHATAASLVLACLSTACLSTGCAIAHGTSWTDMPVDRPTGASVEFTPARWGGRAFTGEVLWATPDTAFVLADGRAVAVPRRRVSTMRNRTRRAALTSVEWSDLRRLSRYSAFATPRLRRAVLDALGQTAPDAAVLRP